MFIVYIMILLFFWILCGAIAFNLIDDNSNTITKWICSKDKGIDQVIISIFWPAFIVRILRARLSGRR